MKLSLNEFFIYLIQKKPFYGRLATSLQRIAKPGLGTMAVGIRDGRAVFFYDPSFVTRLGLAEALFALEHEMLHLILDHIPRYLELLALQPTEIDRKKAAAVYNIAMDCSINTLLRSHEGFEPVQRLLTDLIRERNPEAAEDPMNGLVLPEKFGLPNEATFEIYQWLLMQKVKIVEIAMDFQGGATHDFWGDPGDGEGDGEGEGDGKSGSAGGGGKKGKGKGKGNLDITFERGGAGNLTSEELLSQAHRVREQIKQTLRSVAKSMGGIGRGTMPAGVEEWLAAYLADPIIPWFEVFSTHARMSRMSKHRRSCQLPNRTLLALSEEDNRIIPMPGRVRDFSWRVFFMVDTSGSMSTESLEIAKSELQHMLAVDEGMEIRYMEGDAAVHTDIVLKRGDEIPKEAVGRGGTDFDAYFEHMAQYVADDDKAPDLVVVYTDGYAPAIAVENRLPPEIPVIWLVTPQHSLSFAEGYGFVIVCDPEHNDRYDARAA